MQPPPPEAGRRRPLFRDFHVEATALLHGILAAADSLREARSFDDEPALHLGPRWRLLRAIERCGGAPTFSDLGRLLGMSRQAARELALKAAAADWVELFPSHDDKRALQVMLTPRGRKELEAQRMPQFAWVFMLLRGLEPGPMRTTSHVLRVLRLRLERYERGRRRSVSAAWTDR